MINVDKLSVADSWSFINDAFSFKDIIIHPSMIPFLLPWGQTEFKDLKLRFFDCNHNTLSPFHTYQISNNISGNHLGVEGNIHEKVISNNIRFMGTIWKKVRLYVLDSTTIILTLFCVSHCLYTFCINSACMSG